MNKKSKKVVGYLTISVIILQIIFQINIISILVGNTPGKIDILNNNSNYNNKNFPRASDISGNELYAEQISVNIGGENSLIQQSFISNDTNIFSRIDLSDPAFIGSAFMIEVSDGIKPEIDPIPSSNNKLRNIVPTYEPLSGFYFYNNKEDYEIIQMRKNRAIDILKDVLELDFLFLEPIENKSIGYYYPFVAYSPRWENYFDMTLSNIPKDGYWNAFDKERILSKDYIKNSHLSSSLLYLKDYSMLENELKNVIPHEIPINFDLSSLNQNNLFSSLMGGGGGTLESGNFLNPNVNSNGANGQGEVENTSISENNLSYLDTLQNVVIYSVQYEGNENGVKKLNDEYYNFNLFKTLNFNNSRLGVSEKTYNSMDGIMLSSINVGFYSMEVIESTPEYFNIDKKNIERIESLLFLFDDSTDLSSMKDYSFDVGWLSNESFTELNTMIQNLKNESDYINLLSIFGNRAKMNLPTSMIAPITGFNCKLKLFSSEPSLFITKNITSGNASRILRAGNSPTIEIFVENRFDHEIWGQEMNLTGLGITNDPVVERDFLGQFSGSFFELLGYDTAQIVDITTTLGYNLKDLFHNKNPRLFRIDVNNSGSFNTTYPEIISTATLDTTDVTQLANFLSVAYPYSPEFTQLLIDNPEAYGNIANNPQAYNSSESLFNPKMWKIDAGANFTIEIPDLASGAYANYTIFNSQSVKKIDLYSPFVSNGVVLGDTDINGTTVSNDNLTWDIISEPIGEINEIQQYLTFQNTTKIDFDTYKLDAFNLEMEFQKETNETNFIFEIFNYTSGEFVSIPNAYPNQTLNTINFTFTNDEYNISNFYDENNNFTIIVRLTFQNSNEFSMKFDFIQFNYLDLLNNLIFSQPAGILYCTEIDNNQFFSYSNSLILANDDGAMIKAITEIENTNSFCGEFQIYNLTLINIGNKKAHNVSIKINQLGILYGLEDVSTLEIDNRKEIEATLGNFSIKNNKITLNIDEIEAGQKIENLTFYFLSPNSRLTPPAFIKWENERRDANRTQKFTTQSNQIYLSAPVDFQSEGKTPDNHRLEFNYLSNFSKTAPKIGEIFSVEFSITNKDSRSVYGLSIPLIENIDGLLLINASKTMWIEKLLPHESLSFILEYKKLNYRGYFLPNLKLNSNSSLEYQFMNILHGPPLIIGYLNFEISKDFERLDADMGAIFKITIHVRNDGNIELQNFTIDDTSSYDASGFTLEENITILDVDALLPSETVSFSYKLKVLNKEGIFLMKPTKLEYYFIYKNVNINEPVEFKVREIYLLVSLRIYGPIIVGAALLLFTYKYKIKYNREDIELERRESLLFGQSLRESSWHKMNLTEFFEKQIDERGKKYD